MQKLKKLTKAELFKIEVQHLWGCGMGHHYIMKALKMDERTYEKRLMYMNRSLEPEDRIVFCGSETAWT